MPTVSELTVVVNADVSAVTKGLDQANKQVGGFGESIKNGLGLGLGFGLVGKGIELVGSAFGAAKGTIIDLNGSLEQSKIAFTTMLGSGEKAEAFLGDLQKFAANTPFEFPELVDASKRMLAFGFDAKQTVPLLTAVGDAVAAVGGGKETINGVTTALGQMQAKGKVSAEEMGQLAERGIPAWDMLAKHMGVSVSDAMDAVSKGQVKAGVFIEAFQEGSAARFGGMMEKQSATWSGALSTISDSLSMAGAKAFEPFFKLISAGAIELSKFVQSDTFAAWADAASAAIVVAVAALGSLITTVRGMADIFRGGAGSIEKVRDALNTLFPPGVSAAIIGALADIGDLFTQVFGGNLPGVLDAAKRILGNFGTIISGLVESWAKSFADWIDGADSGMMGGLADMAIGLGSWLLDTLGAIVEKLGAWGAAFVDWIGPKIPGMLAALGDYFAKMAGWMVGTALPTILEKLGQWGLAFVAWIGPRIVPMLTELGKLELELLGWMVGTALPGILGKLGEWALAFVEWVGPKIPPLLLELGKLLLEVVGWMTGTALPGIVGKLVEWGGAFLDWIAKDVLPTLPEKLGAILTAIAGWVTEKVAAVAESVQAIGAGILTGIRDGVSGALDGFWSWLQENFVDKIPSFVRDLLNIHSPSGVFADIGRNIVEGLRVGMEGHLPSIDDVLSRVVGRLSSLGNLPDEMVGSYIRSAAERFGVSAEAALAVWTGEGRTGYVGDHGSSFGPFQLHYGGMAGGGNAVGGLGDSFTADTGLSAMDPKTWKQQIDYALQYAAQHGWGAWHGAPAELTRGYATGGIAWTPQVATLAEREPEAIIPRSWFANAGGGSGGGDIYLDLRGAQVYDGDRFEDRLVSALDRASRRGRIVKVTS